MNAVPSVEELMGQFQTLEQVEAGLLDFERFDAEESLYTFVKAGWPYMDPAPWQDGWPLEAVAEHLEAVADGQIKRLLINIPPRCSKSSFTSVAFPAWVWAQPERRWGPTSGPQVQFLHASYANKLSLRDSVKCRRLIQSPWYQRRWGHRFRLMGDQNAKMRFENDKGGARLITSVDAGTTGEGGMIGILDDPNDASEVASETALQSAIDWWDGTMQTRLNDPKHGAFIVVQQRLAEDDITGHILSMEAGDWCHLMLPMFYEPTRAYYTKIGWKDPRTESGELLWPERFGEKEARDLERRLGPWRAAGQLQQSPQPAGGGIIKREWWQPWDADKYPPMDFVLASLDTAYTEKEENDASAMTVWGVFQGSGEYQSNRILGPDGRPIDMARAYSEASPKVVLMFCWNERLEFHDLVTKVAKTCRQFAVDKLLIENKASGISVSQELRRLYQNDPWMVQLNDPKGMDKRARLYSVQHIFSEGMVYAPDRTWADEAITQTALFPKGKHDDIVDTVSQALKHLRTLGLLTRNQERLEEIEVNRQYQGRPAEPLYPG